MTKPYSYQKWNTARTWPGAGWGEAMTQVRKDQRLTQRDIADYMGVSLATVRNWEAGTGLPDRSMWAKLEEAMGLPVPDPRVPDHTPAERELIDTLLFLVDELRFVRERLSDLATPSTDAARSETLDSNLLDVDAAAAYLGVSTSFIRSLVAQRGIVHYKLGRRVMFRRIDLDLFVDAAKRDVPHGSPWRLRGNQGRSPRRRG
jgi:excisionase family DNA binding protein